MQSSSEINTIHLKVRNQLNQILYPILLSTIPLSMVVAILLVLKMNGHVDKVYLASWLIAFFVVTAGQGGLAIWFNKAKEKENENNDPLYFKLLIANVALIGVLWGMAGVLFMPKDTIAQSCLIFVLSFVAGGGSLYLANSYLAGSLYATGVIIPLVVSLVYSFFSQTHHEVYFNVSIGLICYWSMLLVFIYSRSKLVAENYKQGLVNQTLSEDLTIANKELEKANLVLRAKKETLLLSHEHHIELQKLMENQFQETNILSGVDSREVSAIKFLQSRAYSRRHQQGLAIFCININNFYDVKNSHGADVANLLLKTAAVRLLYCKRETDSLCRIDENKFILVISEVQFGTEIKSVADKITKIFAEKTIISENKVKIDASIGVSLFPIHSEEFPDLVKKAEIALSYLLDAKSEPEKPAFLVYNTEKMGLESKTGSQLP